MKAFIAILLLSAMTAGAQQSPKPAPVLSTADKIAIQSLEKNKQDAQTQFNQAQQAEMTIVREFAQQHPGYHVNASTFVVEADAKPAEKPASAVKK